MSTTTQSTGQAVEVARYVTDRGEERFLIARRVDGTVRVYDSPAPSDRMRGRTYPVEPAVGSMAELAMLRRDYLAQAERLGDCPMSPRALRRLAEEMRLAGRC